MNIGVDAKAFGSNPNDRTCFICGRNFGTASITIHEPKCLKKWHKQQESLPKSMRRPVPVKSDVSPLNASIKGGEGQAAVFNEAARQAFLEQGRDSCPNCSRKFLPDRLSVHLRSCKPGGYFAKQFAKKDDSLNERIKMDNPDDQSHMVQQTPITRDDKQIKTVNSLLERAKDHLNSSQLPRGSKATIPERGILSDQKNIKLIASHRLCTSCGTLFGSVKDKFCAQCGIRRNQ